MHPLERTDSTLALPQTTLVADKPLLADTVPGASPLPLPPPAAAPLGPGPQAVRTCSAHQEQEHGAPAMVSLHLQGRMSPEVTGHCPPKSMRMTLQVTAVEPSLEEAQCERLYKPCPLNSKSCRRSQGVEEGDFAGCLGGDHFLPSARRTLVLWGLGSDMGWDVRRGSPRSQAFGMDPELAALAALCLRPAGSRLQPQDGWPVARHESSLFTVVVLLPLGALADTWG